MEQFAEEEQQIKRAPDAPTKIKGADVLREYLMLSEKPQKFFNFAKKKR